jgi:hypothetical protein
MMIADHPVLSKRAHVHVLPPSWRTLYELTKVPEPVLIAAFAIEIGWLCRRSPGHSRPVLLAHRSGLWNGTTLSSGSVQK